MPVAHGEGCYYADDATLDALERDGQVLFRYVDEDGHAPAATDDRGNPNGSLRAIAGVLNAAGNVAGLMPHPETRRRGAPRLRRRAAASSASLVVSAAECAATRPVAARASRRRDDGRRAAPATASRRRRRSTARSASTDEELDAIRDRLAAASPNDLELAMFSVMWSEHCSYKSSRPLLRTLPTARRGRRRRARARTRA